MPAHFLAEYQNNTMIVQIRPVAKMNFYHFPSRVSGISLSIGTSSETLWLKPPALYASSPLDNLPLSIYPKIYH